MNKKITKPLTLALIVMMVGLITAPGFTAKPPRLVPGAAAFAEEPSMLDLDMPDPDLPDAALQPGPGTPELDADPTPDVTPTIEPSATPDAQPSATTENTPSVSPGVTQSAILDPTPDGDALSMRVMVAPAGAEQVTVTFRNWDGSLLREFVVDAGTDIATLSAQVTAEREGHVFKNWYSSVDELYAYQDATYYAVFDTRVYLISIEYRFLDETIAAQAHIESLPTGAAYSAVSPSVQGYVPDQPVVSGIADGDTDEISIIVYYSPDGGTPYTVRYYLENLQGEYEQDFDITLYADTGAWVTVAPASFPGFELVPPASLTHRVAGDGSTEVELYYNRKTIIILLDSAGGRYLDPVVGKYGAQVPAVPDPTPHLGYSFDGWSDEIPTVFPAEDLAFTARWIAELVPVRCLYWMQNVHGTGYDLKAEWNGTQEYPTGTVLSADTLSAFVGDIAGFTFKTCDGDVLVKGDGSTIINYYYDRQAYRVKWMVPVFTQNGSTYKYNHMEAYATKDGLYDSFIDYWPGEDEIRDCFDALGGPADYVFNGWTYYANSDEILTTECEKYVYTPYLVNEDGVMTQYYYAFFEKTNELCRVQEHYREVKPGEAFDRKAQGREFALVYTSSYYAYALSYNADDLFVGFTVSYFQDWDIDETGKQYADDSKIGSEGSLRPNSDDWYPIGGLMRVYHYRNQYILQFNNVNTIEREEGVLYDYPVAPYDYVPQRPSSVPKGFTFGGWYSNPNFYEETRVNLEELMMPAGDMILHAKWVAPVFTVRFDTVFDDVGTPPSERVSYGSLATRPQNPAKAGYTFEYWYRDFANIPFLFDTQKIYADTLLIAKWTPRVDICYTVKYVDGQDRELLPSENVGGQLMASTVTELAATIEGYLADNGSKSLLLQAEGNIIRFVYQPFVETSYTVRYRNAEDPDEQLLPDASMTCTHTVATERAPSISGYAVDQGYKTIVLSSATEQNVITFYYQKNLPARYTVYYHLQNVDGTAYELQMGETEAFNGPLGKKILIDDVVKTFPNYALNRGVSTPHGYIMPDNTMRLDLYYDREPCDYVVFYYEYIVSGPDLGPTTNELLPSDTFTAVAGRTVTAQYKTVDGYAPHSAVPEDRGITVQTPILRQDNLNQIILYYAKGEPALLTYEVRHYRQATDGSYPDALMEVEELSGYLGLEASYTPKTNASAGYANHTYAPGLTTSEPAGFVVTEDDTLVIRLYYTLDTAYYQVRHHRQDANGEYPDALMEVEPLRTGSVGAAAVFQIRTQADQGYQGYTFAYREPAAEVHVLADNLLIIDLYYTRNQAQPTPATEPTPTVAPTATPVPTVRPAPVSTATPLPQEWTDPIIDPPQVKLSVPPQTVGGKLYTIRDSDVPLSGIGNRNLGDCPR